MKPLTHSTRKLLKVGLVSNILEAYEFFIYASLALIMAQVFFSPTQSSIALLKVWVTFSISYLARPLGSFVWGILGDSRGRGHVLQATLFTMSIPTALIGLLPTYDQVGLWATAGLLILRFAQGFSSGGELPVSGCYVFEQSSIGKQRSLLCSTVVASSNIGFLGASLVVTLLFWCFPWETIVQWAWRLPYLVSIPITFWVWTIRKSLAESKTSPIPSPSVTETIQTKSSAWNILLVKSRLLPMIMICGFLNVLGYTLFYWMPSYLTQFLHLPPKIAQFYNTLGLIAWTLFTFLAGYLSHCFGYRRIILVHILATCLLIYPLFKSLQGTSYLGLGLIHLIFAWLPSGLSGTIIEMLGDAFPQTARALGMSLGFTLSATVFGGMTPLVLTWLTDKTETLIFPAFYIMAFGLLALPVALRLKKA